MAAPTTVLTIIKAFPYRTNPAEEWSNRYMLTGTTPADAAAWRTLFDALVTQEKQCYTDQASVIKGYGHDSVADDAEAIWSVDLRVAPNTPVAGTAVWTGGAITSGDQAAWVRWGLDRMVNGKRIYLRKYFHSCVLNSSGGDPLKTTYITNLNLFGAKMSDGTFLDARKVTDKLGTDLVGHGSSSYSTTRTLKRRGKRHPTTP